ncbi:MAG: type I polyketide synthase, partial [Nitrospira sp.]
MKTIAEQLSDMSAVKIAFAAEQMRAKRFVLDAEPIAIVGLSCRFPGANSPDAYWQLLEEGRDAIREVPLDRWPLGSSQDIDSGAAPDEAYRYGGFIDSIGDFDPTHFGISPREAVCMDPQQRLLMEVTWEALENAGLAPEQLFGSRTSVYVGISTSDYRSIAPHGRTVDRYFSSGTTFSVAAGRLSYALGLKGPTLAVDTACSSSLVAIHLACQSLRSRESDVALAGGVNALLSPETSAEFSKLGVLAPDGRCKAFDASADGYVRGEGCGVVVLKRLASALQSGDRIVAVIRGSALNHDGRSGGLTVPNGPSQEEVIRSAVTQAGLRPEDVKYLEAHGTGTSLGDPIEMAAAAAALTEGRTAENPLLVGSVKTNIGHLEAASGIAGLIKVAMAIQHGAIPRQLHLKTPNPHIAWGKLPVAIVTETMRWPAGRRIAGVSSFGMSGTNAHVILEEPPPATEPEAIQRSERTRHVLPLSAKNEAALKALAARYTSWWTEHPEAQLGDVAFTL